MTGDNQIHATADAGWMESVRRLTQTDSVQEAASEMVGYATSQRGCKEALVALVADDGEPMAQLPRSPTNQERILANTATATAGPAFSADGLQLAIPLPDGRGSALLLTLDTRADGSTFIAANADWIDLAAHHLHRVLELADLRGSLQRLERSERLQHALFAISDLAGSDREMSEVLRGIHAIVGSLMYAENFYIVLYNAERDTLRFLYFIDVEDTGQRDPDREIPMASRERSLTWYLIRDGKPLMGNTPQLLTQISGPLNLIGPEGFDWLGVPMTRDGKVRGAIVVQSYVEDIGYAGEDRTLLEFVADHILIALERKQGKEDLEQRVRQRTGELAEANEVLEQEIVERQRAERLQKALFQIAQLATADISQSEFYRRVHAVVGSLLNAENFFIALLSDDGNQLEFPYYAEGTLRDQPSRPLGRGLSEYVLRHREPLRGMTADVLDLSERGEIELRTAGAPAVCWLGVPLFGEGRAIGLIVVQSYDPAVVYSPSDQELLSFVASQVGNSLQRRHAADTLRLAYAQLEERVDLRTQDLSNTLHQLRDTQDELVRNEKLASLGGLVAGIAHEINTPLGICVTATTHVHSELQYWRQRHEARNFDATALSTMLDDLDVALRILESNIRRGAELVRSFKQVAVDQSSGQRREFDLAEYLEEIVLSLKPKLKHAPCAVRVDCPPGIRMDSIPGALSQVVTNLVMNALLHAFEGRDHGNVEVRGLTDGDDAVLSVSDDGVGMSEANLKQFFDPFFTTKRGSGGTGLGAHIVFNQVTNALGGTIQVTSTAGAGTCVRIRLPRTLGVAVAADAQIAS